MIESEGAEVSKNIFELDFFLSFSVLICEEKRVSAQKYRGLRVHSL